MKIIKDKYGIWLFDLISIIVLFILTAFALSGCSEQPTEFQPVEHQVVNIKAGQIKFLGSYSPGEPFVLIYHGKSYAGFAMITYPGVNNKWETMEAYQFCLLQCYGKYEQWIRIINAADEDVTIEINPHKPVVQ